ncbi:MAG TPA: hypothetical protein DGX96_00385 [Lachnospiraceae bacterium]|nr:hypothetical protein [Lachnospiraceae bacterium]
MVRRAKETTKNSSGRLNKKADAEMQVPAGTTDIILAAGTDCCTELSGYGSFSRDSLPDQLKSEYGSKFTTEQATYAADQLGL